VNDHKIELVGWSKDRDPRKIATDGCPECGAPQARLKAMFRGRYCTVCGWMEEKT